MSQKFINNWSTTLTASALAADTVLTVATAEAAKLGAVSAEDFVAMTLDDGQNIEIVRCTGVSGGDLTVARAQEGTSAQDWSLGTPIECRLTAAALEAFASGADALPSDLAEDEGTTAGLTWGHRAGRLRIGNAVYDIAADTLALTASSTNYVELDPVDQAVKVNQSGFTPGRIPLREVTTDGSSQTASADKRAWINGRTVVYDEGLVDDLDCADKVLSQPEIKDYAETRTAPSSSSGTLELDLENGNHFEVTLTESISTLTLSNPPASGKAGAFTLKLTQGGSGSYTVSWPGSVQWAGGSAPTLTTDVGAVDILTFITYDGGTTWYGFAAGLDFS
jgi:hypothetical protein